MGTLLASPLVAERFQTLSTLRGHPAYFINGLGINTVAIIFFFLTAGGVCLLSRSWAAIALLIGACYMPQTQGVFIGSIWMPIVRLLLLVGIVRVVIRGERPVGGVTAVDRLVGVLGGWLLLASTFHEGSGSGSGFLFMAGMVFNFAVPYLLFRTFCDSYVTGSYIAKVLALVLLPIVLEMAYEKLSGRNLFMTIFAGESDFVGVSEVVEERAAKLRAQGPFRHAILAGSVGATCFPLMAGLLFLAKRYAVIGMLVCTGIVVMSASSGPIVTLFVGLAGIVAWKWRRMVGLFKWICILGYLALELIMARPAFYIVSAIDLTGGSTGWHRAKLVDVAIQNVDEWWLFGTDYTRHWMETGVPWSDKHIDITNYYLQFGVWGGVMPILLLVGILGLSFRRVFSLSYSVHISLAHRFGIWAIGASLLAHAVNSLSISYFDQSSMFFWLPIALINSTYAASRIQDPEEPSWKVPRLMECST